MKNNLKRYRKKAQLTQSALAELVGVNQQLIQRIEAGVSSPKMVVAEKIAQQLNLTVHQLFPALKKSIDALEMEVDRREAEGLVHFQVYFFFSNGEQINHVLPSQKIHALYCEFDSFGQANRNNYDFMIVDTETHRVAINPRLLSHWTVIPTPGPTLIQAAEDDLDEETALHILFSNRTWATFSAEPDPFSTEDNEKEFDETGGDLEMPIGDFFYYLADEYSPIVSFTNLDEMQTHFQKRDIAVAQIALRFVRPVIDDAFDELDDED